jgi:hypothetical protein
MNEKEYNICKMMANYKQRIYDKYISNKDKYLMKLNYITYYLISK